MNPATLTYLAALLLGHPSELATTSSSSAPAPDDVDAMAFVLDVTVTHDGSAFEHHFMVLDGGAASIVVKAEKGSTAQTIAVEPRMLAQGFQVDVEAAVGSSRLVGGIVLPGVGVAGEITKAGMGVEVTVRALKKQSAR